MDRYATNKGIQTKAIKKMVDRLMSPLDSSFTPSYNMFDFTPPYFGPPKEGQAPDFDYGYGTYFYFVTFLL